jgi:hypothetical protein
VLLGSISPINGFLGVGADMLTHKGAGVERDRKRVSRSVIMPDDQSQQASTQPTLSAPNSTPDPAPDDRVQLITRAQSFLALPQVRYLDETAKRNFLQDKGLTDVEVDSLLRNAVRKLRELRTNPR